MANRFSGKKCDELDMTPMVDVTFLLLIFFMITAAFSLQKSIQVPPADDQQAAQNKTIDDFQEDSIIVRVDSDNIFWISSPNWSEEKEAPNPHDMLVKLRGARRSDSGTRGDHVTSMLVLASGDARHEMVVAALDAGTAVGMEDVRLASFEDDDF